MPWAFSRWNIRRISSPVRESRLPVGSSARSSAGRLTRARAMATRCCWPPDICEGSWSMRVASPTCLSSDSASPPRVAAGRPPQGVVQRHQDVVQGRRSRQQVEALEDEAQFRRPHQGPLVGREAAHLLAVEPELARTWPVEAAQDVHERRLAGARGPHQGHHFAAGNGQGNALEHGHVHFAKVVGLGDVFQADELAGDGRVLLCRLGMAQCRAHIVAWRGRAHDGRQAEAGRQGRCPGGEDIYDSRRAGGLQRYLCREKTGLEPNGCYWRKISGIVAGDCPLNWQVRRA